MCVSGFLIVCFAIWRYHLPKFKGIVSANYLSTLNLARSNRCIFSLPGIATQSICADLLEILREILSYGTGGLYARHNRVYNVF
jgi:hypothetical protein